MWDNGEKRDQGDGGDLESVDEGNFTFALAFPAPDEGEDVGEFGGCAEEGDEEVELAFGDYAMEGFFGEDGDNAAFDHGEGDGEGECGEELEAEEWPRHEGEGARSNHRCGWSRVCWGRELWRRTCVRTARRARL